MSSTRSSSNASAAPAPSLDGAQRRCRELLELVVLRDRLGLAADADDRADGAVDDVADEALGRLAARALAGRRHPALAQERAGASRSPSVSSSARLQSIIPAPVASRSSLTSDALIVVLTRASLRDRGGLELGLRRLCLRPVVGGSRLLGRAVMLGGR